MSNGCHPEPRRLPELQLAHYHDMRCRETKQVRPRVVILACAKCRALSLVVVQTTFDTSADGALCSLQRQGASRFRSADGWAGDIVVAAIGDLGHELEGD